MKDLDKIRFPKNINDLQELMDFRAFLGELLETGRLQVETGELQELWQKFKDKQE